MGCHPVREEIHASVSGICVRSPASEVMAVQGSWFRQRVLWLPTWRTCALGVVVVLLPLLWAGSHVHDWLARSDPIPEAKYVVIEGWVSDYVVKAAVDWAKERNVRCIYTTGLEVDLGSHLMAYHSYAELCAQTAIHLGADPAKVIPAPATTVLTERTRAMAAALRAKLQSQTIPPEDRKINLFTAGSHARRSRMHMQHELGDSWQVGVIAVSNPAYPDVAWWRNSEGAKSVITELVALFFQSLGE